VDNAAVGCGNIQLAAHGDHLGVHGDTAHGYHAAGSGVGAGGGSVGGGVGADHLGIGEGAAGFEGQHTAAVGAARVGGDAVAGGDRCGLGAVFHDLRRGGGDHFGRDGLAVDFHAVLIGDGVSHPGGAVFAGLLGNFLAFGHGPVGHALR